MQNKILLVLDILENGGIESVVMNIVRNINRDKYAPIIFLTCKSSLYYIDELNSLGISVIYGYSNYNKKNNRRLLLYKNMKDFLLLNRDIQVVHVHCINDSLSVLLACKRMKINNVIMHSHQAYSKYWRKKNLNFKERIAIVIYHLIYKYCVTQRIGCSEAACVSLFGKNLKSRVIYNSVNLKYFNPNKYLSKKQLQLKYNLNSKAINILFVGRFSFQKNIFFLIDAFSYIIKKRNSFLTIVGYGEYEKEIKDYVLKLNLNTNIKFLASNSCIPELLKAHDIFCGPSICEGLGLVFVEAQLMGIPTFASDAVPKETDLGLCFYPNLEMGTKAYAKTILYYLDKKPFLEINFKKKNNFNIKNIMNELEDIYDKS